jgi:hypothetical protein
MVLTAAAGMAVTSGIWVPQAGAAPMSAGSPLAPAPGKAASGGPVIVVLKAQHSNLNLSTQAGEAVAVTRASQAPIVSSIKASGGTGITQVVAPSAVAAHVSAAEVARLRRDPAVAEIVPDPRVLAGTPGPAASPAAGAFAVTRRARPTQATSCPFNPAGPSHPLQEPEAAADVHASNGNPTAPHEANSIATGKGVIVAIDGMNQLAGNPNFIRPNGTHVVIDAPEPTANNGNAESYGDASSVAAQGTVTYQYSKALPYSPVPAGCSFDIKGDAPGASLVDLSETDTPILALSKILAGIDNVVIKVHANVISESFGLSSLPSYSGQMLTEADNAAINAGVTVVESSGDSGSSGTVITAADDPAVIGAGAVDNLRLVAINDGYSRYVSNQMAALSSGATAPTGKLVNLVAPGWYGGEAACADNSGGCPAGYPTESMRGTSESAPLIAGAAADVIQAYRDTHHGATPTPSVVTDLLTSTATDLGSPADQQGAGLLNAYAAVRAAQQMPGTTQRGNAPSLVVSPQQIDVTGNGGSVSDQSVGVFNTSDAATTVSGSYRWLGPEHQIGNVVTEPITAPNPGSPIPPEGATAAKTISFKVPPGLDVLNADMIWPDPTNSNILQVQLFDPNGALAQESYDDPGGGHAYPGPAHQVSNIQHVTVAAPMPGTWTARILWSGLDVDLAQAPPKPGTYRGPMQFRVSGQDYQTSRAFFPVLVPGHSSISVPLQIGMPRQPGDHPESVQLSAANGAATSLPVGRRTLIPASGGRFSTVITSSVGRDIGQISTYEFNLPPGRRYISVKFQAGAASPDNKFTFLLVNPSGHVAAISSTRKSATTADLYTPHPASGAWQIDVVLNLTTSGKDFTETVQGNLTDPRQ